MSNEQTAPIGAQPEDAVLDAAPETADAPAGDASAQEAPAAQPEREETPAGYVVNPEKNEVIEVDGFTITVDDGSGADAYWNDFICWDALETALVMKDGAIVEPSKNGGGSGCQDGVSNDVYQGPPYVERKFQYAESSNAPRVIDPSQVDYILVCGVRIDMPQ